MTSEENGSSTSPDPSPATPEPEEEKASLFESLRILFGASRGYLLVNWVNVGDAIAYFGMLALMTLHMRENVGFSTPASTFAIAVFSGLVTIFMAVGGGTVCDRLGVRRALSFSMGVVLIGRVVFVMSPWLVTSTAVAAAAWTSIVIMGFGEGVLQPTLYAGVKEYADRRTATMGYALLYSIMNLGIVVGAFSSPLARSFYAETIEGVSIEEQATAGISGAIWLFVAVTAVVLVVTLLLFTKKVEQRDRVLAEEVKTDEEEALGFIARIRALPILDARFLFFICILFPVRTLFAHQFLTMPDYVTRAFPPEVGAHWEWVYGLNPLIIIIFVPVFAAFTLRVRVVDMMIIGTLVSAGASFMLVPSPNLVLLLGYIIIFSVGEALWSSRFLEYVADIAPAGKVGIYMGIAGLPWFMAKFLTGTYAGFMVDAFIPLSGEQQPGTMWLIYAFAAMISPIGLLMARGWLVGADRGEPNMEKVSSGLKWIGALLVVGLAIILGVVMQPRFGEIREVAKKVVTEAEPPLPDPTDPFAVIGGPPAEPPLKASVPAYTLPLDPGQVVNWAQIEESYFAQNPGAKDLLLANGIVSTGFAGDDPGGFYADLQRREIPIFITSDSLLYLFDVELDRALAQVEEEVLFDDLQQLARALSDASLAQWKSLSGDVQEAAKLTAAYFAVVAECLDRDRTRDELSRARRAVNKWKKNDPRLATFARDFPVAYAAVLDASEASRETAEDTDPSGGDPALDQLFAGLRAIDSPVGFADKPTLLTHLERALERLPKETQGAGSFYPALAVIGLVNKELALIEGHAGPARSPIFHYRVDYSEYLPTGHYARSEKLSRYFKAMRWLSRVGFLLKGKNDPGGGLISAREARLQTLAALMIAEHLQNVTLADGRTAAEAWGRIVAVNSFFIGLADNLTPREYHQVSVDLLGERFDPDRAASPEALHALRIGLGRKVLAANTGDVLNADIIERDVLAAIEQDEGMRLLDQRSSPGNPILGQLIYPTVGPWRGNDEPAFTQVKAESGPVRGFFRGLDLAATLGSKRARELLREQGDDNYEGYDATLAKLRAQANIVTRSEWSHNIYDSRLYCLKALLNDVPEGFPGFMRTTAWQDKQLATALGSWSQQRHDTVLYPQLQAGPEVIDTPRPLGVEGYVEPMPALYQRLQALTHLTRSGLDTLGALPPEGSDRLLALEQILEQLADISGRELANEQLSADDFELIRGFGQQLTATAAGGQGHRLESTLITDIHTDPNSRKVLTVATGHLRNLVVIYPLPDGGLVAGVGPVFSYYELKQPKARRLTEQTWRTQLASEKAPDLPQWTRSFARDD